MLMSVKWQPLLKENLLLCVPRNLPCRDLLDVRGYGEPVGEVKTDLEKLVEELAFVLASLEEKNTMVELARLVLS